jgi:peptidoglycan/LPS O-acetylase OafA/YrhL
VAGCPARHRRAGGGLLHPLLLGVYSRVPWLVGEHSVPLELLTAAGLLAAVLAVSTVAYRSVEAPAQRLGRRLNRYLDARLGADRVVAGLAPGPR